MSGKIDLYRKLRPLQIVNTKPTGKDSIAVLSYNLLAQHHIWNDIYPYCRPGILKWPWRRGNLVAELEAYGVTQIMAFQECSKWTEFWHGIFGKKFNGRGKGSTERNLFNWLSVYGLEWNSFFAEKADGRDGLALVYEKERFNEIHRECLSFAPLMTQLEATPNIAQILVLEDRQTGTHLVVSNTHLFWRPEFDSLRALQAHRLRKRIDEVIAELALERPLIIMCGDWNSDPASLTYRLLCNTTELSDSEWKEVESSHAKCMPVLGNEKSSLENAQRLFSQVQQDFHSSFKPLKSAYSHLRSIKDPSLVADPPYTSINSYVNCLDYIFYSEEWGWQVEALLQLPPDEILFGQTALPNQVYSSDHIALWCRFIPE